MAKLMSVGIALIVIGVAGLMGGCSSAPMGCPNGKEPVEVCKTFPKQGVDFCYSVCED